MVIEGKGPVPKSLEYKKIIDLMTTVEEEQARFKGPKFIELMATVEEQGQLMREMDTALGTEAQTSVLARVSPLLKEANEKHKRVMKEWLNLINAPQ